ncbi:hypothetical protein, partial [Salipiger thiooxidans]|uniref:hypothetical protein n=1 Tax=Salipiger thiooxidans TaxID=282683 RepID=UPI001CD3484D
RLSAGRRAAGDQPRRRHPPWHGNPSCTKIETGPPDRGRPIPYVEATFFERLIKTAKPRKLIVVVDDGCRRDDLNLIHDAAKKEGTRSRPKTVVTVLGSARGLVHLKLIYSEMKKSSGRNKKRRIVFGSANATRQGFGGKVNAEILCDCPLTLKHHRDIIGWCNDVVSKAIAADEPQGSHAHIEELFGEISPGIQLRLPTFTLGRKREHLSSFDLWIQRGRLLAKFRPEPTFLKISVPLKEGLGSSPLSNIAAEVGFASPETKTLNFRYIGASDDEEHDEDGSGSSGPWRSQYFTWTNLGEWCSEDCFKAKKKEFGSRGQDLRNQHLDELQRLKTGSPERRRACEEFVTRLEQLWDRFGEDASSYLQGAVQLDQTRYAELFDERVDRDLAMLREEGFRDRYVRGYEINELPRFQNDVRGWKKFVESFAEEVCYQNLKKQPRSKMLKAIQKAVGGRDDSHLEDSSKLLRLLRDNWGGMDRGASEDNLELRSIVRYHKL